MHGRLKVKSNAQKEAEKAVERGKKLEEFRKVKKQLYDPSGDDTSKPTFKYLLESASKCDEFTPVMAEYLRDSSFLVFYMKDWPILWQLRLNALHRMAQSQSSEDSVKAFEKELDLTYDSLLSSPKSYCTWAHRRNILKLIRKVDEGKGLEILIQEVKLTEQMLMSRTESQVENQGRNFHCWDHRRLILKGLPENIKTEIQLTTKLIQTSFSNFSAWHYRSKLLDLAEISVVSTEMELVLNALFTDPSDASSWIYHRYLICNAPTTDELRKILNDHNDSLKELMELEKEEDNNVVTLRSIALSLLEINSHLKPENWIEVGENILHDLIDLDVTRKGYYLSRLSSLHSS